MSNAVNGKGVDRHFLGLQKLIEKNEQKPAIFTDPVFARSCHWNLSTSQISSEYFVGYGWGQVVEDGYGIAYMVSFCFLLYRLTTTVCSLTLFLLNYIMITFRRIFMRLYTK